MFKQETCNDKYHIKSGGKIKYDSFGKHYTWKRPEESRLKTVLEILVIISGILFILQYI